MALKHPQIYEMSPPLTGEDAERLVDYINDPKLPEDHDAQVDRAEKTFDSLVQNESANSLFRGE